MSSPEAIKKLRKLCGLSQARFGARLNIALPTVQRWESGTFHPNRRTRPALRELANRSGDPEIIEAIGGEAIGSAGSFDQNDLRFEYKITRCMSPNNLIHEEAEWNRLGVAGWELIAFDGYNGIFKRRLSVAASAMPNTAVHGTA